MKIVIEIGDKLYDLIKHYERSIEIIEEENDTLEIALMRAIIKGTPLPKGHGDLVDRNELLEYTDINECAYIPTINRYDIITIPTIIKSDKEAQDADSD